MPELPEVETIARTLAPQILGQRIRAIGILLPKVLQFGAHLLPYIEGAIIKRVHRRAKLLLLDLRADEQSPHPELILAFHLKMTGSFFVHLHGTMPLKHTRLMLKLEDGARLFFDDSRTFGYCRLMRPEDLSSWPFWAELGPEPLDMMPEELAAHFTRCFSRRRAPVKGLLLDQTVVAGIGNIYADESLFRSGILPTRPANALTEQEALALAGSLQDILHQAIRECGSSIRDYRDALGNAGAFQNAFAVYGRGGKCCIACGSPLDSAKVGGRSTVFCTRCQK